jgi:Asp-tRNA(Asn)/Glu-tRNA(Gln) amidotransferase A subunit family amidase
MVGNRSDAEVAQVVFELHHLSAQDQWDWLQRGDITPTELAEHYLARIERLNPELGAFTTVTAGRAHGAPVGAAAGRQRPEQARGSAHHDGLAPV